MSTANASLILAGVSAGGTSGLELMWVAPLGTTGPTSAVTTGLHAGFESLGYVTSDGVTLGTSRSTKDVEVYGSITPARKIISKSSKTWDVVFAETNPAVLEVYNQVALGSVHPDAVGRFTIAPSALSVTRYTFVVIQVDGDNVILFHAPNAEVTDVKERKIANGTATSYGCTITPYPDAAGVPVYEYYHVPTLATGS